MIVNFFKQLQDVFTLPTVVSINTIKCVDWRYREQLWFEFDLYKDSQNVNYCFSKQFYGPEFEEHCRFTNEDIPKHQFYEWWESLSGEEKMVEIETFVVKRDLDAEMNEHYADWLHHYITFLKRPL